MADYQRILSYLYRYEKAEKRECLGFVKAEQRAGSLKLTIQIDDERLLQGMELKLCFYEKQKEEWQVWQLDTFITQEHKEELHQTYSEEQLPAGFLIKGQSGVLLYYQEGFYYGSVWIGEEIPVEVLDPLRWHKVDSAKTEEKSENKAQKDVLTKDSLQENVMAEDSDQEDIVVKDSSQENVMAEDSIQKNIMMKEASETDQKIDVVPDEKNENSIVITESQSEKITDIADVDENTGINKVDDNVDNITDNAYSAMPDINNDINIEETIIAEESPVDDFEKMWINSVKEKIPVDNIFNTAFYEGYKVSAMELKDFGKEAGALDSNQFLLKGYERYKHLLAGKVRYAGKERYCVGVPGIYENREKYMAEIYQFPVFLSLTENRMKTGSFGYWLHLLENRV